MALCLLSWVGAKELVPRTVHCGAPYAPSQVKHLSVSAAILVSIFSHHSIWDWFKTKHSKDPCLLCLSWSPSHNSFSQNKSPNLSIDSLRGCLSPSSSQSFSILIPEHSACAWAMHMITNIYFFSLVNPSLASLLLWDPISAEHRKDVLLHLDTTE